MISSDSESKPLEGVRFLIVEDEAIQALSTCEIVTSLGGHISNLILTYDYARIIAEDTEFDCAILDANLNGTLSFSVASILQKRGIPFIFLTAYENAVRECLGKIEAPILAKPCSDATLRKTLTDVIGSRPQACAGLS